MTSEIVGRLRHSYRCYHWLFVWLIFTSIWTAGAIIRGTTHNALIVLALATIIFGYMFFIEISDRTWWTDDQIWWRAWDYLSIKPMRHSVRIDELTEVVAVNHPTNLVPGKPFDRFELVSPSDTITILLSFHWRMELEDLLRLIQEKRPEAVLDPQVLEFMDGGFTDWWRYR